jgi:adenosylcobinamide kinase/adenosylcobinamide-phosphate guanylyltransferase
MTSKPNDAFLLVLGGCRSGKTGYGVAWAEAAGGKRAYLATAAIHDDEMRDRVRRHQSERGAGWITVEETIDAPSALAGLAGRADVVLVDCLTMWITNLMLADWTDRGVRAEARRLVDAVRTFDGPVVVVANEVGLGIVPDNPLARRFRDLAGWVNQSVAAAADRVVFMAAGLPMVLKG